MDFEHVRLEERGDGVAWLVLSRPEAGNAMHHPMLLELEEAWRVLDSDDTVRAIVVTGSGPAFCTGVDVAALAAAKEAFADYSRRVRENRLGITSLHCGVWKPVVCALNGVCAGGGLHFVADSDIVVASTDAWFTDPHTSIGQMAVWEPIGLLRRGWPLDIVSKLLLMGSGYRLPAERAYELGLVADLVAPDELDLIAQEIAATIARSSPSAVMRSKRALWRSLDTGLTPALDEGAVALADFWRHPDSREGPRAKLDGREPEWGPPSVGE